MPEKNYNIIFEKLEELTQEDPSRQEFVFEASNSQNEFDEIKELCRLSVETNEQKSCMFTTT
jgi:hypothetical protein